MTANSMDPNLLNQSFLSIVERFTGLIKKETAEATEKVLQLSSSMITEEASQTLKKFQSLYFGASAEVEKSKIEINREVDDIFEQAQNMLHTDQALDAEKIRDTQLKVGRLGLAAVQKELEALVTVEKGMREKIMPLLNSMQFEDAMRQRLDHILDGWKIIMALEDPKDMPPNKEKILKMLSANSERRLYYEHVMKVAPPPDTTGDDTGLSGLF